MSCMQAGSCCPIFSSRPCDRTLVARYVPGKGKDSSNLLHAICGCCCRTTTQASIATPKEFIQYVDGAIFIPRKYGSAHCDNALSNHRFLWSHAIWQL